MVDDPHFRIIRSFVLPTGEMATVVEFEPFASQWSRLRLSDDDLHVLQLILVKDPEAGDVVPGTNGLRKVRFTAPGGGRGKSGGYRVYYLNAAEYGCLILWAVLSKSERADLTKEDQNQIAKRVAAIKEHLRKAKGGRG